MSESREIYKALGDEANVGDFVYPDGTYHVHPCGFVDGCWNIGKCGGQINIYLPHGGCLVVYPNGTWVGDVAPFAD